VKREYLPRERLSESSWAPALIEEFAGAWTAEVDEAEATLRRETVQLASGLLLPVWDKLTDDHVQVMRRQERGGFSGQSRRTDRTPSNFPF
jgi:hypothetical protein